MSVEYIELLASRIKYFQDKKITELSRDEIKEYLALQDEVIEIMPEVKNAVERAWEVIREVVKPYADAQTLYHDRVLSGK